MTFAPAPVAIFGFNRPEHLRLTLEQLSRAEGADVTPLNIFCDGPRTDAERARTDSVRAVAHDPRWTRAFASVDIAGSERNKGLATSITGGVSEVLARHDRVIVLEDDLIVARDFLSYMNAGLEAYEAAASIGSITAFCPLGTLPEGYSHGVMAVPRNCSHGWATWRDRWQRVTWDDTLARRVWHDRHLRRRLNSAGEDRLSRLRHQVRGDIDSWSIRFGAWQVAEGLDTIYPRDNRVVNIGFDGTGVHCGIDAPINEVMGEDLALPAFEMVKPDPAILHAFRQTYSGPVHRRLARRLLMALAKDPT